MLWDWRHPEFWVLWTDLAPLGLLAWAVGGLGLGSLFVWGVVACRACSLGYHLISALDAERGKRALALDYLGISCQALGAVEVWSGRRWYCGLVLALMGGCNGAYGALALRGRDVERWEWLLVALMVVANLPLLAISADGREPPGRRALCGATMGLAVVAYVWVKPRHHALWHACTAAGQAMAWRVIAWAV